MTRPRVERLTARDCRDRITRALAAIHAPITEDELARRIDTGEACWHEQRAWDEVGAMRYLLREERDE